MGLRRKLAPACGAGDEECVRIFAFGRWGNDPARRWSATAASFWKADAEGKKKATATQDGWANHRRTAVSVYVLWTSSIPEKGRGPGAKRESAAAIIFGNSPRRKKKKGLREVYDGKAKLGAVLVRDVRG